MPQVQLLKEGLALVDSGPLYATILVSKRGYPLSDVAMEGARYALTILKALAESLPIIKKRAFTLVPEDRYPQIVNEMIVAAQVIDDPDFTPLVAVAGATSDLVADYLTKSKATKIIVDNGGDIAVRVRGGEEVGVGLCLDFTKKEIDYSLPVKGNYGICTSGIGGRSFTLGVANAVVVLADRASVADAVATYLGNKTNVDSYKVKREWSEEMYPDTDIPGKKVTISVGDLSDAEIQLALENGQREALQLIDRGVIHGAAISVKNNILPLGIFRHNMKRSKRGLT